jgi:hypothetical protein
MKEFHLAEEQHIYNHRPTEPDDRLVSVEFSQGQSGKRGCTVKAYGEDVADALAKASAAFSEATRFIEAD